VAATVAGRAADHVVMARVCGAFGVRGRLRVYSYTQPPENLFAYREAWLSHRGGERGPLRMHAGRRKGHVLTLRLAGVEDREQAEGLRGADVLVARAQLPRLADDEYY